MADPATLGLIAAGATAAELAERGDGGATPATKLAHLDAILKVTPAPARAAQGTSSTGTGDPQSVLRARAIAECTARTDLGETECALIFDALNGQTEELRNFLKHAATEGAGAACAAYVTAASKPACEKVAGIVFDYAWETAIRNWGGQTYWWPHTLATHTRIVGSFSEIRAGEEAWRLDRLPSSMVITTNQYGRKEAGKFPAGALLAIKMELHAIDGKGGISKLAIPKSKTPIRTWGVGSALRRVHAEPFGLRDWAGNPGNGIDLIAYQTASGRDEAALEKAGVFVRAGKRLIG